jgi:hypothetical protein
VGVEAVPSVILMLWHLLQPAVLDVQSHVSSATKVENVPHTTLSQFNTNTNNKYKNKNANDHNLQCSLKDMEVLFQVKKFFWNLQNHYVFNLKR